MADVDEWVAQVAAALDVVPDDVLPDPIARELLDLTGQIAHSVVRLAVPLSSYLIGVAVGRGATPLEAITAVARLLPDADTTSSD